MFVRWARSRGADGPERGGAEEADKEGVVVEVTRRQARDRFEPLNELDA
jgi:hypothetical protein